MLLGRRARAARPGWGLTVLDAALVQTALHHGPLPGFHQDITLAESWAFWMFLRFAPHEGGVFHTDSKNVETFWNEGPFFVKDPWFMYSSICRKIWKCATEIGVGLLKVVWIKGHAKQEHIEDGLVTVWANKWVDGVAKFGSALHPIPSEALARSEGYSEVLRVVVLFLGDLHVNMKHLGIPDFTMLPSQLRRLRLSKKQPVMGFFVVTKNISQ